jgi:serine/threonine protein kinase/tetratricopeptide (TPR) repeat protein
MVDEQIRLGPFVLHEPLAEGGMGQVWAGVHEAMGLPVAVKVVHSQRRNDPAYQRAFRTEVRAMAGLDHPHVVRVYDTDRVPTSAARASRGQLQAGAMYLVMERLAGDLGERLDTLDWRSVRDLTRRLLGALAHAHARGVLHRDLKPANILVGDGGEVKLTDFGLAQLQQRTEEAPEAAGTPSYMAPEQLRGDWRRAGPWTDLYALGTVVWEMVTGAPPYGVLPSADALRAHSVLPLPSLVPRFAVPSGLEPWLRRLLCKRCDDRYQRCADALIGLDEVDRVRSWVRPGGWSPSRVSPDDVPTELTREAPTGGGTEVLDDEAETEAPELTEYTELTELDHGPGPMRVRLPLIPPTPPGEAPSAPPLLGAGLGLVAQRRPPLVGRSELQVSLWDRLRQVAEHRHAWGVLLHGSAGYGKTRLAEWLLEVAHASGAAHTWRADQRPPHGTSPVASLLTEVLSADGLRGADLRAHLDEWLGRFDHAEVLDAVQGVLDPRDDEPPLSGRQLFGLVHALASHVTQTRPLVLLLDDAPLAREALQLARYLVRGPARRLPILVLVTADDEAITDIEPARLAIEDLLSGPRMSRMEVGPLPRDARRSLVRSLLGVGSPLVDRVVSLTDGHPLFAVELVRSWMEEGSLRRVDEGYALEPGARRGLPPDLARVWARRLRWVLRDRPREHGTALELAAVLGDEVDLQEWRDATTALQLPPADGLVDALLDAGIVRPGAEGAGRSVTFRHRMLREAALERVRGSSREARLHAAAAAALQSGGLATAGRRGRHLLAAGHARAAVEPLLAGAAHAIRHGDPRAESLLDGCAEAMRRAHVPPHDRRWGELLCTREALTRVRMDGACLEQQAMEIIATAERHGWADIARRGTRSLATAYRLQGRHLDALPLLMAANAMARADNDPQQELLLAHERALVLLEVGRIAEGLDHVTTALQRAHDQPRAQLRLALDHVSLLLAAGRGGEAGQARRDLGPLLDRAGSARHHAHALELDAAVHRAEERFEESEAAYLAARRRYLHLGHDTHALAPGIGLSLLRIAENRFGEAELLAADCLQGFRQHGHTIGEVWCHGTRLPGLAARGHWKAFDASLEVLIARQKHPGFAHADLLRALAPAATFARQQGRALRAQAVADLFDRVKVTIDRARADSLGG